MNEYSLDLQKIFVEFLSHDHESFVRVNGILDSMFFDRSLRSTIEFIQEHASEYGAVPTPAQIKAKTGIQLEGLESIDERHQNWFIDEFEQFAKHKALEAAILSSADLLEKNEYGAVEKLIKDAVQIGLAKDIAERIERVRNNRGGVSTGWKDVDSKLFGGFNRGELNIFAAASGGGKSLFLQNLALNWALAGLNVVYVSLELSEELCSLRLDSMLTGYSTTDVFKNASDVDLKVRMQAKGSGALQIVQLRNGITVNDLTSYVKELEVKSNTKIDAILVDYLDLMMPAQRKVPPSDLFIKDKFVSEELRNFAIDHDILLATASQLNRGAVEEIEFDHSHISGGLSKIQTADNVIGIFTSQAMREHGKYQVQFMKTRSSSGVGHKVELAFDIAGLRITDMDPEEASTVNTNMFQNLKKKTSVIPPKNTQTAGELQNTIMATDRLRSILKKQD